MCPSRRTFLVTTAAAGGLAALGLPPAMAGGLVTKPIPNSGEAVPVIGMGTSRTFNVGSSPRLRDVRTAVLKTFLQMGGRLIDSSPMYGSSEAVIGYGLTKLGADAPKPFAATKVWTPSVSGGPEQMADSERLWGGRTFDLMQVHNLVEWRGHLETLQRWKAEGRVRHLGITTSHGWRHEEFADVMTDPFAVPLLDTVQFTYNILDREAEARLLPLAAERKLAVIANRPFRRGQLFGHVAGKPLPGWAANIGCANWAQVMLKFIVSHPAVTCAIPATTRVDHMAQNMGALTGPMPDAALRRRMVADVESL